MKWLKQIFALRNVTSTVMVILVLVYFPMFFNLDFLDPVQNTLEDFQITDIVFSQIFDYSDVEKDTNIVLVNIANLNRLGIARQIQEINKWDPAVIGVDAFFRSRKDPFQDSVLAYAFSEVDNLVLSTKMTLYSEKDGHFDSLETSNEMFIEGSLSGFTNFIEDGGNFRTIRKFTPMELVQGEPHYSFSAVVTKYYDYDAYQDLLDRDRGPEIINYRRDRSKYFTIDALELFERKDDLSFIKGKIVLLGFMGPQLNILTNEDIFFTPMNERYVGKSYPDMYGVTVHANIISMLLDGEYMGYSPDWMLIAFTILLIHMNMVIFTLLREKRHGWYEPVSVIMTFGQVAVLFVIILMTFYFFHYEFKSGGVFFAVVIVKQAYELYNDSLKKIFRDIYRNKFKKLRPVGE